MLSCIVSGQYPALPPYVPIEFAPDIPNTNVTIVEIPYAFEKLWPKTSIRIGYGSSSDFIVDKNNPNSFYNATISSLEYFAYCEKYKEMNEKKTLLIENGLYTTSNQIWILSNNTDVSGENINDTIIQLADNTSSWLIAGISRSPGLLRTKYTQGVHIHDMTIDGNKIKQIEGGRSTFSKSGVYIQSSVDSRVSNIKVRNFQQSGIVISEDKITEHKNTNINIYNSIFENNDDNGVVISGTDTAVILNSTFQNNVGSMKGNGCSIYLTGDTANIAISRNVFNNENFGVITNMHGGIAPSFVTITNNVFQNVSETPIYSTNSSYIYFQYNLVDNSTSCMKLNRLQNSIISNNICEDIILWSGKRNYTGFEKCLDCMNTTITANSLTSDAISISKFAITNIILAILIATIAT
jgi:hypothetical protein